MDTTEKEQKFVVDVYNKIAQTFSNTRQHNIWNFVKDYLNDLPKNVSILDAGCGNGKNMIDGYNFTGLDISAELAKIAIEKTKYPVHIGSVTNMPFADNNFDHVLCIAVIHHLDSNERRKQCIDEIIRVLKKDGTALISAWENEYDNKRKTKDGYVDWKISDDTTYARYYYLFDKNELDNLVDTAKASIIKSDYTLENFYIVIKKL